MLSSLLLVAMTAAPMADAWPYAAKRLPDGAIEYAYDLTPIKAAQGSVDAHEAHGDLAVAAFLKTLPREVKVRVAAGATVDVTAGRGPESRPLAQAFSQVYEGPLESDNPLAKKGGARLRPPLHPDEPKLLVSAEMLAYQVRALEESALAAAELDTESMRRDLWSKIAERAALRFKTAQGDDREGSLALAARAMAANACLDATKLPDKTDPEVNTAAAAEISKLAAVPDIFSPPPPWSWSPELTCASVRLRVLGSPLEQTRGGTAAEVIFFELLAKDPKLKNLDARIRARRDHFLGKPASDPLTVWETTVKGDSAHALESLSEFIESLPITERRPPALLAMPTSPFMKFLSELSGAERGAAWDELASAVQDGRLTSSGEGWSSTREAELVPFVSVEQNSVQFDSAWRDQLKSTFALLQGGSLEARATSGEPEPEATERSELRVRLMVPPLLEVEPLPEAFARAAKSLEALVGVLSAENLQSLRGLSPEGRRTDVLLPEAKRLIPRLKGLAALATGDGKGDVRELAEARRFVSNWNWKSEPGLTRDVRSATAFFLSMGSERSHAAIVGVARRELVVAFSSEAKVEIIGAPAGLETDTAARQHYLVPVLKTVSVTAPAGLKTLDRSTVRTLVDGVARDYNKVDEVIIESLRQ